ncbi:MAG: hypothetical protein KIT11_06630 [Fimbriimonadaceae bacterium]|nr:hypothetical protein [Fimbriimonadaceae bacterium]QYK56029.1 MAG: hypothetical protein KF733_00820 [Fimbriimonadaceae bacterium]
MARKKAPDDAGEARETPRGTTGRRLTPEDLSRLPWRSVGPAVMGGRVSDLCFEPGNPKTFYMGFATGGLWVTKNRGTTFEPIFDKVLETSSIGSVAVVRLPGTPVSTEAEPPAGAQPKAAAKTASMMDEPLGDAPGQAPSGGDQVPMPEPVAASKGFRIWVGTGEGNGRNSSSWGNGVYRSDDGGKNWVHCGLEDSHDIPRLVVDPRDPDVCYVAALGHLWGANPTRGVYKTTDAGRTWEPVLQIDDQTGCCEIAIDPENPDTLFAAMYHRRRTPYSFTSGGPQGGLFKTTDGGRTWRKLAGGLPEKTGRIGLDVFPGDSRILVAVVEATEGGANSIRDDRMRGGGVFRSEDGGETWARFSVRSPRAFYFSKVRFDPKDSQRVYMLGWTCEVSDDGGRTFRQFQANLLHADHHAIIIAPDDPEHIVIGTDGGTSQSFDRGATWDFLNTIATGQFYNISLDMGDPYRIIGGLQDNGTWIGPSAGAREVEADKAAKTPATGITNAEWQYVNWGDGFHADFDPEDPDIVYAEWQGGNLVRVDLGTGERRYIAPEAREGQPRHRFNWNSPFFVSQHDPSVIYHAGNYVFKITDRGEKWEKISPDLTTADPAKIETVGSHAETHCTVVTIDESPRKAGVLWTGSDDGLIYLSKDDGGSWKNVTPKEVGGRYVSRVVASAHADGRAYASIDGHRSDDMDPLILATEDWGRTWTDVTGDLPKGRSVKVVREDLFSPDVLYCGTENAAYVTLDRGRTWVRMNGKALPPTPVDDIKQHPRETDVVLGTHGRSIYVLDSGAFFSQLTPEVLASPLHLFDLQPRRPIYRLNYQGLWSHKIFRAANPSIGPRIDYWIGEYTGEEVKVKIEDAKGNTVRELSGSNAAGWNRVTWDLQPEDWLKQPDQNQDVLFNPFHVQPGDYQVTVTMGDHKATKKLVVLERL